MTAAVRRGPIVIDTDVFGSDLIAGAALTARYAPILAGRPAIISFQTVAELRYGAMRRGWGEPRMLRLEAKLMQAHIEHSGPELVTVCAHLRAQYEAVGHALCDKQHNANLWIAATAIRLGVPLVSHDRIFRAVPGFALRPSPPPEPGTRRTAAVGPPVTCDVASFALTVARSEARASALLMATPEPVAESRRAASWQPLTREFAWSSSASVR